MVPFYGAEIVGVADPGVGCIGERCCVCGKGWTLLALKTVVEKRLLKWRIGEGLRS